MEVELNLSSGCGVSIPVPAKLVQGWIQNSTNKKMKMKKSIIKFFTITLFALTFSFAPTNEINAQCPMCKMSAEQNLKDGGTAAKGLNQGILYMFVMPYLLVGCIGFVWYRNRLMDDDGRGIAHDAN